MKSNQNKNNYTKFITKNEITKIKIKSKQKYEIRNNKKQLNRIF